MNTIKRFEQEWTPQWDLGIQDEFQFPGEGEDGQAAILSDARPNPWAMASREVEQAQTAANRRIAPEASSLGDVIQFFEALIQEVR